MTDLAENIRFLRCKAGDTQAAMAAKIGVKQVTVSSWEKRRAFPTNKYLRKLAEVYSVPVADLVMKNLTNEVIIP